MLRAFAVLVLVFLGAGAYVFFSGGATADVSAPGGQTSASTGSTPFGFALAAGAVALSAAFFITRPRGRLRR